MERGEGAKRREGWGRREGRNLNGRRFSHEVLFPVSTGQLSLHPTSITVLSTYPVKDLIYQYACFTYNCLPAYSIKHSYIRPNDEVWEMERKEIKPITIDQLCVCVSVCVCCALMCV